MSDSLSSAEILDGVCGVVECGDSYCVVAHTLYGLESDTDGTSVSVGDLNVVRVDDRHRGSAHTETVLHEWLHKRLPEWNEDAVLKLGRQLSALLHLPEIKRRSFS